MAPLLIGLGLVKHRSLDDLPTSVLGCLIGLCRMCFSDVHDKDNRLVSVGFIQSFHRTNLVLKWRSRVAAEQKQDRLFSNQLRQRNAFLDAHVALAAEPLL